MIVWPVDMEKAFISSPWGWRIHPITGVMHFHNALDIASYGGSNLPIFAATEGVVREVGWHEEMGNYVRLEHINDNYFTRYIHLESYSVSVGQLLKAGQQLGIMGTTGTSTGVHLDFQVSKLLYFVDAETDTIDPEIYLKGGQPPDDGGTIKQTKGNYIFVARRR